MIEWGRVIHDARIPALSSSVCAIARARGSVKSTINLQGKRMNAKSLLVLVLVGGISGCAAMSGADKQDMLLNPPGVHVSPQESDAALDPGKIPVDQYYAALTAAKDKEAGSAEITNMVDKGVGLVSAYCLRWFRRLDDTQRRVDLTERDFNVIRQLGTALLGIGKASSAWVAGYGATNTAYSGIVENFNEAVLAGPTSAKVKSQVLGMLQQSEVKLRADASQLTFSQAYSRIELHADTCTYSTVRNLLDSTLAATVSKRDPETGKITSERIESTYQFDVASGKLQNFWRPNGTTDKGNEGKITQWMKNNQLSVSIPYFINTPDYASLRAKAVKDLNL